MQTGSKPTVNYTSMEMTMETYTLTVARQAVSRYNGDWSIARRIGEAMDEEYGGFWHCVISDKNITIRNQAKNKSYIDFKLDDKYFWVWQACE